MSSSSMAPPGGGAASSVAGDPAVEWVEIVEPRTKEHMFANLTTGECVWDPPAGVPVKRTSDDQWWELFDQNTSRFYYYNAASQKTVWHRPNGCDIIPLAKLQTLKQNTEVREDEDGDEDGAKARRPVGDEATQTAEVLLDRIPRTKGGSLPGGTKSRTRAFLSTLTQTSPTHSPKAGRRPFRVHRHHHHHHRPGRAGSDAAGGILSSPGAEAPPEPRPRHALSGGPHAATYATPQKSSSSHHQRFLPHEQHPTSPTDRRRTTIGPSQAKYYSIPNRGERVRQQQQQGQYAPPSPSSAGKDPELLFRRGSNSSQQSSEVNGGVSSPAGDRSPFSSISRSMSFMSKQPSRDQQGGGAGWRASYDANGGRRSVESTPQSARRVNLKSSPESNHSGSFTGSDRQRQSDVVSPIEGYCTPMINRKTRQQQQKQNHVLEDGASGGRPSFPPRRQPPPPRGGGGMRAGPLPPLQRQPPPPSQQSPLREQQLSISELVDSGLSTLTDGVKGSSSSADHSRRSVNNGSASNHHRVGGGASLKSSSHKPRSNHHHHHRMPPPHSFDRPSKMSPLQQYILEQAKMSGYRFGDPVDGGDRDSYVESEDDLNSSRHGLDSSDDFADDEDGGVSADELSKASSVDDGEDDDERYLSEEPTYNNLDPVWLQSLHGYRGGPDDADGGPGGRPPSRPSAPSQQTYYSQPSPGVQSTPDVDAFSEEFDIRMRFSNREEGGRGGGGPSNSSNTMPRPVSHQPTSSLQQQQQQQQQHHHHPQYQQNPNFPVPYEVLHPSLQRNTHSMIDSSSMSRRTGDPHLHRAASERPPPPMGSGRGGSTLSVSASLQSESDIERYAQDNLNIQKKGLFRKKMTVKDILSHTREPIRKPLTCLRDKAAKKEAVELFRLVQIYMGDRRAKQGMTINSVAQDVTTRGFATPAIRDEIFVQLCKQTTENGNSARESLRRGWELMAICLAFFPPSPRFAPALQSYIQRHRDPALDYPDVGRWPIHVQISHYAGICAKRLDRIGVGGRLRPRKPTVEEIDQARLQIFRPSMFGGTLCEVMELQHERFPQRRLPWILTTLADQILQLGGTKTEGIFRVPADLDEVMAMKSRFDQWETPTCSDCHTAASLLKLWLRELYEPLIPDQLYDRCVAVGDIPDVDSREGPASSAEVSTIVSLLQEDSRLVLGFLVRLLQLFARPDVAAVTKMDAANLGTVFAPNCLRCPSQDPCVILENTRKEMAFVKALIFHLDTSGMEGVL